MPDTKINLLNRHIQEADTEENLYHTSRYIKVTSTKWKLNPHLPISSHQHNLSSLTQESSQAS